MNDEIINKLKKLLRLSESSNANEAEVAFVKARELAVRHDIELGKINAWGIQDENRYEKGDIDVGRRESVCGKFTGWILGKYFNVRLVYTGSRLEGKRIVLVGKKSDIELAQYVYGFLNHTFMRKWHEYREKMGSVVTTRDRGSFLYGMYTGLCEKLDRREKEVRAECLSGEDINKYALMVINKKEELDNALGEFFPNLRKGAKARISIRRTDVLSDGVAVGRTIQISKGISGGNQGQIGY